MVAALAEVGNLPGNVAAAAQLLVFLGEYSPRSCLPCLAVLRRVVLQSMKSLDTNERSGLSLPAAGVSGQARRSVDSHLAAGRVSDTLVKGGSDKVGRQVRQ
jgi:hypothetical protein